MEKLEQTLIGRPIKVKKAHIREGRKNDCRHCPVALALLEAVPGAVVSADLDQCWVNDVPYVTPERVEQFMNRFDYTTNRESISGFTFTFEEIYPVRYRF